MHMPIHIPIGPQLIRPATKSKELMSAIQRPSTCKWESLHRKLGECDGEDGVRKEVTNDEQSTNTPLSFHHYGSDEEMSTDEKLTVSHPQQKMRRREKQRICG